MSSNYFDRSVLKINRAFNFFSFYRYRGNFLLGARYNKLLENPIANSTYIYHINGIPVFHYKFMWLDYIKKVNFLKKLFASKSDLWYITNRFEFLGILDAYADQTGAKLFHYNARRMFQEGYVGVAETLDFRMKLMGIKNASDYTSYHKNKDKYYFLINNQINDKLFLDEMIEPGYNDEPRLCISTANTDSLYINTNFYGLFGNNVPMSSKFFYFALFKRCYGTDGFSLASLNSRSRFLNLSNHSMHKLRHISMLRRSNYWDYVMLDSGFFSSKKYYKKHPKFNIRFNHIHNIFVVKKLFKYFHSTRSLAKGVDFR